ncbi:restriction endonuclease subunit S [Burkholderia pseudomallei]
MTYVQALRATTDLIRDGQELRYSNFTQVDLPLVPLEEQKAIAEFLDRELSKFDKLSAEAITAIELLRERRKALVSAAVTGQIDARGTVALTSDESALAA